MAGFLHRSVHMQYCICGPELLVMEFDKERGITDEEEVSTIERSFRVLQPITGSDPT
jgi:hypothetical protein